MAGAACGLLARPTLAVPGLVHALERLPAPLPAVLGTTNIGTPDHLLDAALSGLIAPLLFLTYAIGVGARAGGLGGRSIGRPAPEWPMSRERVLLEAAALTSSLVAIAAALWAGAEVGAAAGGLALDPLRLVSVIVAAGLLGLGFGAIALGVVAATGRRALANWTATGLAMAADAGNGLAAGVHGLFALRYTSPIYYAEGGHPLERGISVTHLGVLVAVAVGLVGIAAIAGSDWSRRASARSRELPERGPRR